MSRDHRKLKAFQLADALTLEVYRVTRGFPREEQFGLTSQLRRATAAVPTNIVEGCGRRSQREYVQFLNIAFASLRESGYLLSLAQRLGYLSESVAAELDAQHDEAARTLGGLLNSYRTTRSAL